MSRRRVGDPGAPGLDLAPYYRPPPPIPSRVVPSGDHGTQNHVGPHISNFASQNSSPSEPDPQDPGALERRFAPWNPYPAVASYRTPASYPGLIFPRRSRSPEKKNAPPFQYRAPPRPIRYHLSSSRPAPFSNVSTAASSSRAVESSSHNSQLDRQKKSSPLTLAQPPFVAPFDPAESFAQSSRFPQLVPPDIPGGYNPLLNPYIPQPRSSSPKLTKKPGFWGRAKRKFSGRRVSSTQPKSRSPVRPARLRSPITPTFTGPSPPTPSFRQGISQPQAENSCQKSSATGTRKASNAVLSIRGVTDHHIKDSLTEADEADTLPNQNPFNDWETKALLERAVQPRRAPDHRDFSSGAFEGYRVLPNHYRSELQGSAENFAPQIENSRICRDPEGLYFSQIIRHKNRAQLPGCAQETSERIEIPASTFENSESSPVPSYLFEGNSSSPATETAQSQESESSQEQDSPRLPEEINLDPLVPESIVGPSRIPLCQEHKRVPSGEKYFELCHTVPDQQLAPGTPEGIGRKHTYFALFGQRATDSLCLSWEKEVRTRSFSRPTCNLGPRGFEQVVEGTCSQESEEQVEENSPSRGRGRLQETQATSGEESSTAFRRRRAAARRRQRRYPVANREGAGERTVDHFIPEQREVGEIRTVGPGTAPVDEVGELIAPTNTLSLVKQGVERRRRKVAALDEIAASANETLHNQGYRNTNPLENTLWKNTYKLHDQSDLTATVDEDLVEDSDIAPPIPRKSVKRLTDALQQYSSQFREQDLEICVRSKTGTVKGLPVTPENQPKVKPELQQEACYTASCYSPDDKDLSPRPSSDLHPSPLVLKTKSPTPPSSRKTSHNSPSSSEVDPFHTTLAFLDKCLSVSEDHLFPTMETLQVSSAIRSSTKTKAEEDARAMQKSVIESCKKAGRDSPKYVLMELIGKGSFGRVYKGKHIDTTKIVAVKIIDIDESDTLNPRLADTYSEFMKEVNALKILSESKAKNINHVIEALPVGTAMWMITEYCGGGSIATLMKPTPNGLKEKFIIPVLREVAEAVKWVHQAGIIHRDLKCANILITEEGGVQLCDFGVAGITETALDKRSTFIGTFHWMAPELFQGSQYGKEVDIWAFGSMTYEMATGLPPSAMSGLTGMDLGPYLKTHIPRLDGGTYSEGLKNIVAFCLEENPSDRPSIEAVQRHSYIYNTSAKYPSSGLSDLVKAFKLWESHGGTRKSLFGSGGAQGPSELSSTALSDDSWNFSTTPAFDQAVSQDADAQDIINVYGASVALSTEFEDETTRPVRQQQARPSRRRPPPEALAPLKAPLEKLFDPNTMSNYKDNAMSHFNLQQSNASDLPLRDDSAHISIRDTLIDLDAHDVPSGVSSFADMDTMKPARRNNGRDKDTEYEVGDNDEFTRPALSDPVDNPNRRTQDWKFPSVAPPASANPDINWFPVLQRPSMTPASGARPALVHHPTEPISIPTQSSHGLVPPAPGSDRMSLIDLDLSIVEPSRPSTADSAASQDTTSANPFIWERHASMYHRSAREPSLYFDDSTHGIHTRTGSSLQDLGEVSDFSASDAEGYPDDQYDSYHARIEDQSNGSSFQQSAAAPMQTDYEISRRDPIVNRAAWAAMNSSTSAHPVALFHPLPPPPSAAVLSGTASNVEMHSETHRMFGGLRASLETFRDAYESVPTRPPKSNQGNSGDDTRGASSMHDIGPNIS